MYIIYCYYLFYYFNNFFKVCARPFPSFKWKAGVDGRFKKTEICLICAKLKNVCQTCLLDLEFGLPVQIRDAALPEDMKIDIPESEGNRNYFNQIAEKKVKEGMLPYGKTAYTNNIINVLARKTENYMRNRSHVCSFWMKGSCNRGEKCPYRHELPDDDDENKQKQDIKDRYFGKNDPVAQRLLARLKEFEKKKKRLEKGEEDEEEGEEEDEDNEKVKDKSEKARKRDNQEENNDNSEDNKEEKPKRKKIDYSQPTMYPSMNPQRMGSAPRANKPT